MKHIISRIEKLEEQFSKKMETTMDIPLWRRKREELERIMEKEARGERLTAEEQEKLDTASERALHILEKLREAQGFETLVETVDSLSSKRGCVIPSRNYLRCGLPM